MIKNEDTLRNLDALIELDGLPKSVRRNKSRLHLELQVVKHHEKYSYDNRT